MSALRSRLRFALVAFGTGAALSSLGLVACTGDEQVLGGGRPTPPQPTTVPTTWTNALENNCPKQPPTVGTKCDTFDEQGNALTQQCSYGNGQQICICATGAMWACFRAAPGLLTLEVCVDGGTCVEGVGCGTREHECTCGTDGKLQCRDRAIAP